MKRIGLAVVLAVGCAHQAPEQHGHTHATAAAPVAPAKLFDGLGGHHRAISSKNAEAQKFFDQGLRLVYAFNHDEAQRSFEEAARLDPTCGICSWGAAMVLGPNYNLPADPQRSKAALAHVKSAVANRATASPVEQALIDAVAKRYADPPPTDEKGQAALDNAYSSAMREAARKFPDDDDVQVIFGESLMDLRPWKLWDRDGKPAEGTLEILGALEKVLARNPTHPGANHYYIHAMEASPHPEKAMAAADRVGAMMPAAGHLVHMPSHIYQRVGRYGDSAEANRKAIAADKAYVAAASPQGFYAMYVAHNFQFLWAAAMMDGRGEEAVKAARDLEASVPIEMFKQMPMMAYLIGAPALTLVRFGRWDEALKEPAPPQDLKLAVMNHHYMRARAFTGLARVEDAGKELATLEAVVKDLPKDLMADMAPAPAMGELLVALARGELLLKQGKKEPGLAELRKAVAVGDTLPYAEPPDMYYPPRHTLGARLLQLGRAAEAEKVYRADLVQNPHNGWALTGLVASLKAQKKPFTDEEKQRAEAFTRAEKVPTSSDP
jgi:tetratricopeptide (TPR) repeat protein